MSECIGCGTEIPNSTTLAYCTTCMVNHVVLPSYGLGVHKGIDWAYDPEWKYCPHCGERLA